jgi:hypothetical protein
MKTIREQQEERRQLKLAGVRRQVKNGSLVIRQMTPEERKLFPVRPATARSTGARTPSRSAA